MKRGPYNLSPEERERRRQHGRNVLARPDVLAKATKARLEKLHERMQDPAYRQKLRDRVWYDCTCDPKRLTNLRKAKAQTSPEIREKLAEAMRHNRRAGII